MYTPNDDKLKQIQVSFTYHAPKETQQDRYVMLKNETKILALDILHSVPPGREQTLAITKLEERITEANYKEN